MAPCITPYPSSAQPSQTAAAPLCHAQLSSAQLGPRWLCGAAGTDCGNALPVLFIHRSQMRVLPPTSSRALWSKQGKLFLEKNQRERKIRSHQYFPYALTTAKELVNKAGAGCACASHGCCRLPEQQLASKTPVSRHQSGPTRQSACGKSWNVTHGHLQSCSSPLASV